MLICTLQGFNPSSYKTLLLQKYNYKVKAKNLATSSLCIDSGTWKKSEPSLAYILICLNLNYDLAGFSGLSQNNPSSPFFFLLSNTGIESQVPELYSHLTPQKLEEQ